MITENQKADFYRAFIIALMWSSVDDEGEPLDVGGHELAPITKQRLREYCDAWCDANTSDLKSYAMHRNIPGFVYEQAGHDFALTANGHGTGFCDRGIGELGERLSKAAKANYLKMPDGYTLQVFDKDDHFGYHWKRDLPEKHPSVSFGSLSPNFMLVRFDAWTNAFDVTGQTPPESAGQVFETYTGDDDLIYVSGFEE